MNGTSETGMDMTAAAWRLERSQGYAALAEKYGNFESHMDQGRRTAFYSGFGLARTLFAKPTDAALIEEAARRGMSVMDAAEAARLRGVAEAVRAVCDQIEAMPIPADSGMSQTEITGRIIATIVKVVRRALLHVDTESEAGA